MKIKHEDFTFHDHQQTSQRIPERDEREARHEDRARRQGAARETPAGRPLRLRILEAIQAVLSPRELF